MSTSGKVRKKKKLYDVQATHKHTIIIITTT